MGNTSAALVSILALIMFSTFFMTLQARSTLHGHNPLFAHKKVVAIENLLHKSGIHISKHVHIPIGNDLPLAPADRLAPGGPDPQHNKKETKSRWKQIPMIVLLIMESCWKTNLL
ncbi:hypothetical protein GLYMA_12G121800v4 [Glycine max]|uniref:Uncharacterized protein n=1 Tax=Glycine max TaxID=3847 RepID=K7LUD2_SOYBN|nr:CLAVATA3/ESR (CLE)-related protein 13 [Glycine max]KRH25700.1 hypothetical protein GLYMA_12G121800v4 [Glycine max]